MARTSYTVLIADDSEHYVLLLKDAFQASRAAQLLGTLANGQEVVDYFQGNGPYADRQKHPIPDVLILDLRMPLKGGFEVLHYLRRHGLPTAKRTVILTGLAESADILRAHELGAHFITQKQSDLGPLVLRLERAVLGEATSRRSETPPAGDPVHAAASP